MTSTAQAELRRMRKEAGLCVSCGRPAKEGRVRCEECLKKGSESQMKRYYEKLAASGKKPVGSGYAAKYEYTVWCGNKILKQGHPRDVAEYLGISVNQVVMYAQRGERRRKGQEEPVLIERKKIDGRD